MRWYCRSPASSVLQTARIVRHADVAHGAPLAQCEPSCRQSNTAPAYHTPFCTNRVDRSRPSSGCRRALGFDLALARIASACALPIMLNGNARQGARQVMPGV